MTKIMYKMMAKYWSQEDGLVTIEWVGIAAVVVVAGIVISGAIMTGAGGAGGEVVDNLGTSGGLVPTEAEIRASVTGSP